MQFSEHLICRDDSDNEDFPRYQDILKILRENSLQRLDKVHHRLPVTLPHSSAVFTSKTLLFEEGRDLIKSSTYTVPIYCKPCPLNFNHNPALTLMSRKKEWIEKKKRLKHEFQLYNSRTKQGREFQFFLFHNF